MSVRALQFAGAALVVLALPLTAIARDASKPREVVISDETHLTRWAHPSQRAPVHSAPSASSSVITRLHYLTEDGKPEIYLVLRLRIDVDGATWARVRVPMRPNGTRGWVRRSALGQFHTVRTRLVIHRRSFRAILYRRGHRIWSSRIGVGKPESPTPAGHFYVREKLADYAGSFYGPIALGTSAYSRLSEWPKGGVVGVHGTSQPELLPGRVSHGCIRVPNDAIVRLASRVPLGTPVLIR
jgi:hypothetical protein